MISYTFKEKKICPFTFTIGVRLFRLLLILLFFSLVTTVISQEKNKYTVIGRVIDENGQPVYKADIRVSPVKYILEERALTDEEGKFSITKEIRKGETFYLYVSKISKKAKYEWTMIDPPFFWVNVKNKRFFGKPIKFGDGKVIDLGDVNVQFWFGTVYIKFQINGRNLTEEEWKAVWCRLKDENGTLLWEESVGPKINAKVDLEKSILKLSLPEGKWKLEFNKFDYGNFKVYSKILGQTAYFVIDKDKESEIIDVKMNCRKCF